MTLEFSPHFQRLIKRVNFRIKTQQYDQAIELLEASPSELMDSKEVRITLAQLYIAIGNNQAALKYLRRLYSEDPDPSVAGLTAILLCTEGRFEEALSLTEEGGEDQNLAFAEALARMEIGKDYKKAETILETLTQKDARFAPYLFQVEILRGKFDQAQRTLSSFTEEIVADYNSGVIDLRLTLPSNAKRSFRKVRTLLENSKIETLHSKWRLQGYESENSKEFKKKLEYFLSLGEALGNTNPYTAYENLLELRNDPAADHYLFLALAAVATRIGKPEGTIRNHIKDAMKLSSDIPHEFIRYLEVEQ